MHYVFYLIEKNNLHQCDAMLDEELYNKHHDDELHSVMVDLDEMMMKEHLLK